MTIRRTRNRDVRGQAIVESAVVLLTFVALLAGLIDLGRMFMTMQALQHGVREGVRYGVTGRTYGGYTREQAIAQVVVGAARQGVDPADITIYNIRGGAKTGGAGGANDILIVSVAHPVRVYSPWLAPLMGGTFTARAQAALRNEDFDDATVPTITTTTTTTITTTTSTSTTTMGSTTTTRATTTTTSTGMGGSSTSIGSTTTTSTTAATVTTTSSAGTTTTTVSTTTTIGTTSTRPGSSSTSSTRGTTTTVPTTTSTTRPTGTTSTTVRTTTTTTTTTSTTTTTFPLG